MSDIGRHLSGGLPFSSPRLSVCPRQAMAKLRDVHQAMLEAQLAKLEGMLAQAIAALYIRAQIPAVVYASKNLASEYTLLFLLVGVLIVQLVLLK